MEVNHGLTRNSAAQGRHWGLELVSLLATRTVLLVGTLSLPGDLQGSGNFSVLFGLGKPIIPDASHPCLALGPGLSGRLSQMGRQAHCPPEAPGKTPLPNSASG